MRKAYIGFSLTIALLISLCSFTQPANKQVATGNYTFASDSLEKNFISLPKNTRPKVFWDWMGGLISKHGITKDLEALASQGIGGVMIMQMPDQATDGKAITFGDYKGKVKCLSNEWFEMINFAIGECDRLGLTFSIFICPGWSHVGGPWITPEYGLKKLQSTEVEVTGPLKYNQILPRAPRILGVGESKEEADSTSAPAYYKDMAVIAIPMAADKTAAAQDVKDITRYMDANGRLKWNIPTGKWTIVRLNIASENGKNHPSPPEGVGIECDRMNPKAVRIVFDGMVGRILREAKAKGYHSFTAFETDSYEAGYQDISNDYRDQFKRLRGYDCLAWLPAWTNDKLIIGSAELTQRFRDDMRQTISDLHTERFHGELRRLADKNGLVWMTEPYWGMTLDWHTAGARSSMPGSEFWAAPNTSSANPSYVIGASVDIAALYGLPVVWAESFTAESYNSSWRNDPYFLKPWGDLALCKGLNQFFMHGFTHNPFDDQYQPGVSMGFWGTQMTRHATWWPYSLPWHTYLARCQYMLQQGWPVNDVLSYPSKIEGVSGPVVNSGDYRQVVMNDESLFSRISVVNGRIEITGGGSFAAIALAQETPFKPEALRKLRDLVADGAVIISGRPPAKSPGLKDYPTSDKEVAGLLSEMWGAEDTFDTVRQIGKGWIINTGNVSKVMDKITGGADVRFNVKDSGALKTLNFVHRRDGDNDIYFVCNISDNAVDAIVDFRTVSAVTEQWDAVTGTINPMIDAVQKDGRTQVPIHFAARQSFFIVFKKAPSHIVAKNLTAAKKEAVLTITGKWDLRFDTKWGGPAKVTFDSLQDWSKRSEEGIRYYSGTAVYNKGFDVPSSVLKSNNLLINLGQVHNIAKVNINGQYIGIVWCSPWEVAIPQGLLKLKNNKLVVQVVNTWANRLIGDEQKPDDCELVEWNPSGERKGSYDKAVGSHYLKDLPDWLVRGTERPKTGRYTFSTWRFYNKDAPLTPAGLLGPVSIIEVGE